MMAVGSLIESRRRRRRVVSWRPGVTSRREVPVSFVIAQPEMIAAAAGELASIRSAINAANAAAAAQTTGVMSAAADEVSTAVAALFSSHAQAYQAASAQAAAFHAQVVRTLTVDAGAYASAEAANAGPNMLAAVNAPPGAVGAPTDRQRCQRGAGHRAGRRRRWLCS
ncbi:putative PE family protein, partial [Mycobacterium tuberculosis SUMu011]